MKVAGVNFTHASHVVLHTVPSSSATLLAEHSDIIVKALKPVLGFDVPLAFDLSEHWHHVACHCVPVPFESRGKPMSLEIGQELVDWNNVEGGGRDFLTSLIICKKKETSRRKFVTLKITVKREETAQHLCSMGIFLFGAHCRVSTYHCRKSKV
jgi:hypothetical protein